MGIHIARAVTALSLTLNRNTCPFTCNIGSSIPIFRDIYLDVIVRKKYFLYFLYKIHHIYLYQIYKKNNSYKNLFFIFLFYNTLTTKRKLCAQLPEPVTLLKKSLRHRCFPEKFAKFLRTPFLQNTSGRLLLKIASCFKQAKHLQNLSIKNSKCQELRYTSQPAITCSKLTIGTLEQGVKYVQS